MSDPNPISAGSFPLLPSAPPPIQLPVASPGVTLKHEPRELRMHSVTEEELTTLRGVVPTTAIAFLGIAIGASLAFYTTLQTASLATDTRHDLNSLFIGARLLTAFFAVITATGYAHLWFVVRRIKRRPVP